MIEKSLNYDLGTHCALYEFLMDYIKDVFLGQIHSDNSKALDTASHELDSWKAISDVEVLRDYQVRSDHLAHYICMHQSLFGSHCSTDLRFLKKIERTRPITFPKPRL